MAKTIIYTKNAPEPIGPYSQAILVNNTLYVSGQIPINPKTKSIETEEADEQTRQVMENIKAILVAANMNLNNVVKCSIFLKDMNSFVSVNKIYGFYFNNTKEPARECVEVSNLPKDALVEISCIACL